MLKRHARALQITASVCLFLTGCERKAQLEIVADFGPRQCTGVAVSAEGRTFVSFPRWSVGQDLAVAEVMPDGSYRPYPNQQTNLWQEGDDPRERFVCAQSVYIDTEDPGGSLWVLDSGNPCFEGVVPNAAKLVLMDLESNQIERTIRFDSSVAPRDSYLNDVRVNAARGFAYITDSGLGAIVVVNLNTNRSRRVLTQHKSTRAEPGVSPVIGGRGWRLADGSVPQVHADGMAISVNKEMLYYKALTGKTLYRVPTTGLRNFSMPDSKIDESVESLGPAPVCDGMVMDREGRLYLTALEKDAILRRLPDGKMEGIITSSDLRWPDSLAFSKEGDLYVTSSQIHLAAKYNEGVNKRTQPYVLYKIPKVSPPPRDNSELLKKLTGGN